jgi:hypothetical protein
MILPIAIVAASGLLVVSQLAGMCIAARSGDQQSDTDET